MAGILSPFGSDDDPFDGYDEFVPENVPSPDRFLEGHDVLYGKDHVAFHRLTRELFEERTVYDMTFDYNLARLNLDSRHPDAGFRYAEERSDADDTVEDKRTERVLRADFTPTTPFCPQSHTLTIGAFRAWNGLSVRHEYDLVRVRTAPMHHEEGSINDRLEALEETYLKTGDVSVKLDYHSEVGSPPVERDIEQERSDGTSTDAPF